MTLLQKAFCLALIPIILGNELSVAQSPQGANERFRTPPSSDPRVKSIDATEVLICNATAQQLGALVGSGETSIALAAGWERVRRTIHASSANLAAPDALEISRFIGLVEGRTRVPVPTRWSECLLSAKVYDTSERPMTFNISTAARPDGENWRPKTDFIARTEGTKWVVRGRGFAWSPPDILVGVTTDVVVTSADDLVYVALVAGGFSPYQLIAVNRVSQRTVWSSEVWTRPRVSCSHGFCLQSVILVPGKESVVVFGSTCGAVYLAAYRAVDGSELYRFNSADIELLSHPGPSGTVGDPGSENHSPSEGQRPGISLPP